MYNIMVALKNELDKQSKHLNQKSLTNLTNLSLLSHKEQTCKQNISASG